MGHKPSLGKFNIMEIVSSIFFFPDHDLLIYNAVIRGGAGWGGGGEEVCVGGGLGSRRWL